MPESTRRRIAPPCPESNEVLGRALSRGNPYMPNVAAMKAGGKGQALQMPPIAGLSRFGMAQPAVIRPRQQKAGPR